MTTVTKTQFLDVQHLLATARYLNEAIFMASGNLGDRDQTNAIQAVSDELNNKLLIIGDRLDEIREGMA